MSPDPKDRKNEKLPDDVAGDALHHAPEDAMDYQQADWDEIQSGITTRKDVPIDEIDEEAPLDGEQPGEDDDTPYMESDEALPDDAEERVLRRNPSKEGGTFDEV